MLGSLAPNFGLQNAANRISGLPDVKIFWGGGGGGGHAPRLPYTTGPEAPESHSCLLMS